MLALARRPREPRAPRLSTVQYTPATPRGCGCTADRFGHPNCVAAWGARADGHRVSAWPRARRDDRLRGRWGWGLGVNGERVQWRLRTHGGVLFGAAARESRRPRTVGHYDPFSRLMSPAPSNLCRWGVMGCKWRNVILLLASCDFTKLQLHYGLLSFCNKTINLSCHMITVAY